MIGKEDSGPSEGHASDCAVYSEPAYPAGPCDCGMENMIGEAEVAEAIRLAGGGFFVKNGVARAAMTAHLAALEAAGRVVMPRSELADIETEAFMRGQASGQCEHHWIGGNDGSWCTKCGLETAPPAQNGEAECKP